MDSSDFLEVIDGGVPLLHAPPLGPAALALRHVLRHGSDGAGLAHVEPAHSLLVRGQLVRVEHPLAPDQAAVTYFSSHAARAETPRRPSRRPGRPRARSSWCCGPSRSPRSSRSARLIVRDGREAEGLPDGLIVLEWAKIDLSEEKEVDGDPRQVEEGADDGLLRLLGCCSTPPPPVLANFEQLVFGAR